MINTIVNNKNNIKYIQKQKLENLLLELNNYILNNDIEKIKKIYIEFKKPENKLSFELLNKNNDNLYKMEQIAGKKDDKGFWEYSK